MMHIIYKMWRGNAVFMDNSIDINVFLLTLCFKCFLTYVDCYPLICYQGSHLRHQGTHE